MCGIFCSVGDNQVVQDRFIKDMFVMDSLRGIDSCGLIAVDKDREDVVKTFKRAVFPHDFLDLGRFKTVMKNSNKVIVGHNRWGTKGGYGNKAAHPFTKGDITLVHNGTLTDQTLLPDHTKFKVDSENIAHSVNKIGIKETWKKLRGAAALMWWDNKEHTFNFIRNKERPLFFTYSKDLKKMYAASEKYMLLAGLERNKLDWCKVEDLPVNTLYSFKVNIKAKDSKEVVKCTTTKLEAVHALPIIYNRGKKADWYNSSKEEEKIDFIVTKKAKLGYGGYTYTVQNNKTKSLDLYFLEDWTNKAELEVDDCATGETLISRSYGKRILIGTVKKDSQYEAVPDEEESLTPEEEEAWNKLTVKECGWCGDPVQKDEDYLLTSENQVFCSTCKGLKEVSDYVDDASNDVFLNRWLA